LYSMSDAALAAYIQGGMGGSVPRPEITGRDMTYFIYYLAPDTNQGSYPTPVAMGALDPDTTPPVISNLAATRLSSTSIQLTWTTDKPSIGFGMAGSAFQVPRYNVYSAVENGFSTSHSVIVSGLPMVSPIHYSVLSKDQAGNNAYTNDQTIA